MVGMETTNQRLPRRLLGIAIALSSSMAWSQNTAQVPPSNFEAAVITPADPASSDVWLVPESGGGLRAQNVVVWQLIKNAYYIRDEQLEGGPPWVKSDRYDIVARPGKSDFGVLETTSPAQAGSYLAQSRLRMQALLKDRFALTLRTEERAKRFYALKLSERGLRVRPAGNGEGGPVARMRNGQLSVTTDAKGIAALLTDVIGTTVVDETGLAGYYTVNLEWNPEAGDDSILAAVRDQIGLELELKTGPLAVFVIERIEKPSAN